MYVSGSLNSLSTRHLHQEVPASCLWVPVTPGRTPAWTEHGDQPGVAGCSSICLRQFIPVSAFNMNDCLLVTSSHGIRFKNPPKGPQDRRGVWENGSSPCRKHHCWDLQGTREAIQSHQHFLGRKRPGAPGPQDHHPRQRFPAVGRHRVPGGILWNLRAGRSCPVSHTPPEDRTPQPTDARDSRDITTGQVGPKEKRADVQALRPRQAFRGRNPPEHGRLHHASPQAAKAVVTPHPPPALFRDNYYIQRKINLSCCLMALRWTLTIKSTHIQIHWNEFPYWY